MTSRRQADILKNRNADFASISVFFYAMKQSGSLFISAIRTWRPHRWRSRGKDHPKP